MADNKTVFTLEFQDGGTIKAKTNDVKALNTETGKAVAAAKAMSNTYDQARAGGEGTGAAGRDFAKQLTENDLYIIREILKQNLQNTEKTTLTTLN